MAERIESDGHNFYRKAAELFDNHYIHDLLINLAQCEKKHKELFASLTDQLSSQDDEDSDIDSDDDLSLYLRAMEGLDVFKRTKDTIDELTGDLTPNYVPTLIRELTPDIQLIINPALNPDENALVVFGLRARMAF